MVVFIIIVSVVLGGLAIIATKDAFEGTCGIDESITGRIMPILSCIAAIIIMICVYNGYIHINWGLQLFIGFILVALLIAERALTYEYCDTSKLVTVSMILNVATINIALMIAIFQPYYY